MKELNVQMPIYKKIALDIAVRICSGKYKVNDKLIGRSVLAGEYNVSPETIRRAMNILEEVNVIASYQGIGYYVLSQKSAYQFVENEQLLDSIHSIKKNIYALIQKRKKIDEEINELVGRIVDYANRFKSTNPINPVEVSIEKGSHLIGRTILESQFWQKTGATIMAIRRAEQFIISPGASFVFNEGDSILIVFGDITAMEKAMHYVNPVLP